MAAKIKRKDTPRRTRKTATRREREEIEKLLEQARDIVRHLERKLSDLQKECSHTNTRFSGTPGEFICKECGYQIT